MNKIILIGRLTRDPELRSTPSGNSAANFSIAVNRNFKNKEGVIEADFFNVTVWNKQAENVNKYCSKGTQVGIEGRLQNRNYEDKDGIKRYATDVIADRVEFLSRANSAGDNSYVPDEEAKADQDVVTKTKETEIPDEDPFKDFGSEVVLTDDDLPF